MAKVNFRQNWFAPDGTRFRKGIREVKAEWLTRLPSSAKIVEEPVIEEAPAPSVSKPNPVAKKKSPLAGLSADDLIDDSDNDD